MGRPKKNRIVTERKQEYRLFSRKNADGTPTLYIRFLDEDGTVFLTRAAGTSKESAAHAEAGRIMATEDLAALLQERNERIRIAGLDEAAAAEARRKYQEELASDAQRIAKMTIAEALELFWDPKRSPYIEDRRDSGKPLSGSYIRDKARVVKNYIKDYPAFTATPIRELRFGIVDDFLRKLRRRGVSKTMLYGIINTIRKPCTWLATRGAMPALSFKVELPGTTPKERGILTTEELEKIINLPVESIWYGKDSGTPHIAIRPRPRLAGQEKHEGAAPVEFRMKLFVVMGALTGMRRGELRALQWRDVDFKTGRIAVDRAYTDLDGLKDPKARSKRTVVMPAALEPLLLEAKRIAQDLSADGPEDFVLYSPSLTRKPMSDSILKRGWDRVLRAIGITEEDQQRRNLVVHGLRHYYASRLIDAGLNPPEVAKLTGHRTMSVLGRYADHVQESTLSKAKGILDGPGRDQDRDE